ncbi:NUDIX domain-containing protein [Ktedonosporobacter rubrisoli]|uniref:NUDIX domain-containing protein n=1 Tax=Ktedonosporobacter rubrisoli TaxID=2509675 RepID=A0A4P6JJJ7_KTERU|nr:NUDIX domain-containing protein [Ktedonosporobacter rubrisoli]QBD75279.1 NUDIX domain-containing protein [Ktedonosporobacter rubrisoli]
MMELALKFWKLIPGKPQWYVLWLTQPKFIIGVSGVIFDEHKRILLLRHRFWKAASWGLPGGFVLSGEKLEEALCREVREETNYIVEIDALLRMVSGYRLRLEVSFVGRLIGGELCLDPKEISEARFFDFDQLPEGLLPSHRELIALALSRFP